MMFWFVDIMIWCFDWRYDYVNSVFIMKIKYVLYERYSLLYILFIWMFKGVISIKFNNDCVGLY